MGLLKTLQSFLIKKIEKRKLIVQHKKELGEKVLKDHECSCKHHSLRYRLVLLPLHFHYAYSSSKDATDKKHSDQIVTQSNFMKRSCISFYGKK